MRTALIIVGLLVSLAATPQEIYRWVDRDGIVHYADRPGAPDAERVTPSVTTPSDEPDTSPMLYQREPEPAPDEAGPAYRALNIVSPESEEVFFGGADAVVEIRVEIDGRLAGADELRILLDGTRVPSVTGSGATVSGLPRGAHSVQAAILGPDGRMRIESPAIIFHVRQQSIANPPTGPAVSPRPRPPGAPPRPTPLPSRGG